MKMKPIKTFKIGSNVFFDKFEDFTPKDIDELCIMDCFPFQNTNSLHVKGLHNKDAFFYKNMSKQEFIQDTLNSDLPMVVGKFIIPEFNEYLNITIDDLKQLKPIFDKIDTKHEYEKIIYNSYIENNGFYLTDEQLNSAYEKYKETHKNN